MGTNDCCCGRWTTARGTQVIGIVSAVLSVLACIGFSARSVQLSVVEVPDLKQLPAYETLPEELQRQLSDIESQSRFTVQQAAEFLRAQIRTERLIVGCCAGTCVVSFVVAVLLIFAAKKNNRYLALPFMVWTILCAAVAGMFGVSLLIAYPVLRDAQLATNALGGVTQHLLIGLVLPFVFVAVAFKLYTWWLIVVFDFYNRLKYAAGEPPFDSIPMQTA